MQTLSDTSRRTAATDGGRPEVDAGRRPIKRTVGDLATVEADAFTDGHDGLTCVLRFKRADDAEFREVQMEPLVNDRFRGAFPVSELGRYRYTLAAWLDRFGT